MFSGADCFLIWRHWISNPEVIEIQYEYANDLYKDVGIFWFACIHWYCSIWRVWNVRGWILSIKKNDFQCSLRIIKGMKLYTMWEGWTLLLEPIKLLTLDFLLRWGHQSPYKSELHTKTLFPVQFSSHNFCYLPRRNHITTLVAFNQL